MWTRLFRKIYNVDDIRIHENEIHAENRQALKFFAYAGLLVSVVNAITQAIVRFDLFVPGYAFIMPGIFIALILANRFLIPEDFRHTIALFYAVESIVMLDAVLLGTVLDPTHQAITILLLSLFMPAFIMDNPLRSDMVLIVWAIVFVIASRIVKEPYLFYLDTIHMAEFLIASLVLNHTVIRIRLNYIRKLRETGYVIDHDPQTGIYSRQALRKRIGMYLNQPAAVLTGILDNLTMYSDFYGHDVAHNMMVSFSSILSSEFGEEHTYRYRGNEFFCVILNGTEEECKKRIAAVRKKLEEFEIEGRHSPLSADFGYVIGTAAEEQEFRQMAQLADIYLHKAGRQGENQTYGTRFDQTHLREGIIESSTSINAPAYEINTLTGLAGMSYFTVRCTELLNTIVDVSRRPVIGYLKLMRLRQFNNEFGYASGDLLIKDTANLLSQVFRGRQICYITAGKFCVMCYLEEAKEGMRKLNEILATYKPGFHINAIAGFAEYTGEEPVISLLDRAKIAEQSIRGKKEEFCLFDKAMDEENQFRQYILNHVDEAIENDYIKVYYQPIARAITGQICNEEALARWDDPRYGFLMPYRFVPVLEDSAMMYKVNLYVVSRVLEDMKTRNRLGVPVVPVSVNLSRTDFEQCDMVSSIAMMVDDAGFSHDMIRIEITESAFTNDQELLKREVNRFRENGFEVWLDDFGSEYSTLNLLQEIDFDLLKIDMQFMKNFSTEGKNFIIISDIIDMAKRMGITTLIEGIETTEHYEILQKLGCEKIQGYLFNRPNSHDYIIERALSGTGLRFEDPAAAPYYEAIGRIDLNKPSNTMPDAEGGEHAIPSAVLERKDGTLRWLAATEPFLRIMRSFGMIEEGSEDHTIINPAAEMLAAAAKCDDREKRFSFSLETEDARRYTFYMRRVSNDSYNGAVALMTTILQNRTA